MNKMMVGALVALTVAGAGVFLRQAVGGPEMKMVPETEMKFEPSDAGYRNGQVVALTGDPKKGAHGSLFKFMSQMTTALHTHSVELQGVVVSGTMQFWADGQAQKDTKPLPPGSFFTIPAGFKHITACVPPDECLVYFTQKSKFDFKAATPAPPKPEPKPAPTKK